MLSLRDQDQRMDDCFTAFFKVLRLLTPLQMSYEAAKAAKKRAEPYTKIVEELLDIHRRRRDPTAFLWCMTRDIDFSPGSASCRKSGAPIY
ncbi:MAG: hypothetical protein OEV27_16090 [Nitrospira sp.]|nr:hypothetical protein [Nitrospira sp.]